LILLASLILLTLEILRLILVVARLRQYGRSEFFNLIGIYGLRVLQGPRSDGANACRCFLILCHSNYSLSQNQKATFMHKQLSILGACLSPAKIELSTVQL
jgi:hypothetical protein